MSSPGWPCVPPPTLANRYHPRPASNVAPMAVPAPAPDHTSDPRHRVSGHRRLRQPGDGALARFAAAADRGRSRHHRRRRLDRRVGLFADARHDAAIHGADRRPVRQIPHGRASPARSPAFRGRCAALRRPDDADAARLASGLFAAWIIPMGMAFVGDVVPYERRQQVLGRYLTGQITGPVVRPGRRRHPRRPVRLARGVLRAGRRVRDCRGRAVLSSLRPIRSRASDRAAERSRRGLFGDYAMVLREPLGAHRHPPGVPRIGVDVRRVRLSSGADLHLRFGLSYTADRARDRRRFGIGGLIYAASACRLVDASASAASPIVGGVHDRRCRF